MNALLINPPKLNTIRSEVPGVVRDEGGQYPCLGLLHIQAYARAHADFDPGLTDADALGWDYGQLRAEVAARSPALVGITALTHNLVDVVKTVAAVREACPSAHVCLGGPHVNAFPDAAGRIAGVDTLAVGDGEETFAELGQCLSGGQRVGAVAGLIVKRPDGSAITTPARPALRDLDSLPFPDRSGGQGQFFNIMGTASSVSTLVTSRGCPFRCTFCSTPRENYRERSAANVVDEMGGCLEQGFGEVYIVDDTFNVRPERVLEICDLILARGLSIKWSCRLRIDRTTEELLARLKDAGCTRVQYGVETGTDEGLDVLGKGITVAQVRDVVAWTKRAKLPAMSYFMIGCPHERTADDVMHTIRFACELDTDMALFNVLTPMPGSELHRRGVEQGVLTEACWERYMDGPCPDFQPEVWEEHLTREELYRLLDVAYRKFYLRPRVLWRRLLGLRSWTQLKRQARAAVRMVIGGE